MGMGMGGNGIEMWGERAWKWGIRLGMKMQSSWPCLIALLLLVIGGKLRPLLMCKDEIDELRN